VAGTVVAGALVAGVPLVGLAVENGAPAAPARSGSARCWVTAVDARP